MTQGPFFHVGMVVEDLEVAMAELSLALDIKWRTPHESRYGDWTIKVVYSLDGPPFLELIQGEAGGPWDTGQGSRLDHIGYYSEDVVAESERLAAAGLPVDFDPATVGRGGGFCYHRTVAAGARIEIVSVDRRTRLEQENT